MWIYDPRTNKYFALKENLCRPERLSTCTRADNHSPSPGWNKVDRVPESLDGPLSPFGWTALPPYCHSAEGYSKEPISYRNLGGWPCGV